MAVSLRQLAVLILRRRRARRAHEERLHAAIRRRRRARRRSVVAAALACALAETGGGAKRRSVKRVEGGWPCSTLAGYLDGDEATYAANFRMTKKSIEFITEKLSEGGYLVTNRCRDPAQCITARFKVGVCLYFMAHAKGDMKVAGDVVGTHSL